MLDEVGIGGRPANYEESARRRGIELIEHGDAKIETMQGAGN
jgi:hypothetical protein